MQQKNPLQLKKTAGNLFFFILASNKLLLLHLCKALAAVYRAILTGLEGNCSLFAAGCTYCCEHFALGLLSVLAVLAASLTSLGLVYETLGCIKFLFACFECKFSAAFFADESLVFVHGVVTSL